MLLRLPCSFPIQVDVEGAELDIFPQLVESEHIERVKQIGVEFHGVRGGYLKYFVDIMQKLYRKGFKIIAFDPNYVMGQSEKFMPYFEIVFRRVQTSCDFDHDVS